MQVAYMINIGTRDLTRDGSFLEKPRSDGKIIFEQITNCKNLDEKQKMLDELNAPILYPGLTYAVEKAGRIDMLIFFVSNQPEATPSDYREKDTLFIAELLRFWLYNQKEFSNCLGQILIEYLPGSPADYNSMIPFFRRRIPELVTPDSVDFVYIAPVGGADASNVGLWLAGIRTYQRKCQLIYVLPDGKVERLELYQELTRDVARHQANILFKQHDYIALAKFLEEEHMEPFWLIDVSKAAHHWLHFDFKQSYQYFCNAEVASKGEDCIAFKRLKGNSYIYLKWWKNKKDTEDEIPDYQKEPPDSSSEIDQEDESPDNQEKPSDSFSENEDFNKDQNGELSLWDKWLSHQRRLLSELFINLEIKRDRQEWVDFVGRLFRMHEAILRLCFEEEVRHTTEKRNNASEDFVSGIKKNKNLVFYLKEKRVDYDEPNTHVLGRVLDFWVEKDNKGKEYGKVRDLLKIIECLSELRNKSIIAHGYQGISREDIEKNVSLDDLWKQLTDALYSLGVQTSNESSPFTEIQKLIKERLK